MIAQDSDLGMMSDGQSDAVIFDLDGVLADTQSIHAEAESRVLVGVGIDVKPNFMT